MCETIDHRRQAAKNILVEFERDQSLRATEVIVINQDRAGDEKQAVKMICFDNGDIQCGQPVNVFDDVDLVI